MNPSEIDIVKIAIAAGVTVAVTIAVGWIMKCGGAWIIRALQRSFGEVVSDVMAPEMAHHSTKVTTSIDAMAAANHLEHTATAERLTAVETRQSEVEHRTSEVEARVAEMRHELIAIATRLPLSDPRDPTARTRTTDQGATPP